MGEEIELYEFKQFAPLLLQGFPILVQTLPQIPNQIVVQLNERDFGRDDVYVKGLGKGVPNVF